MKPIISTLFQLIKPTPGSGIVNQIKDFKTAWNEGKKIKALARLGFYLVSAILLIYLIEKGLVSSIEEAKEMHEIIKILN